MKARYAQLEMEPFYGFFHAVAQVAHQAFFRGEVVGMENLPASGGYIVAANHLSHLDPPIVGQCLPLQVAFFARKTLWKRGVASWWLDKVGSIPVDRDGGTSLDAIRRVLHVLAAGRVVIMFPEGTRSLDGRPQTPKAGVGLLACRAQVPVVPTRIFGSYEAFRKKGLIHLGVPVSVAFGKPLQPADYDNPADGKERYSRTAARIMAAIMSIRLPVAPII